MPTNQVAVRITDQQLQELDWLVAHCDYDSRGEALRAALSELTSRVRNRQIDEQIRRSYAERPETDQERFSAPRSSWDDLDDEDWSDW